jgi:predicted hydrolase (HD superfamily)
MPLPTRDAALQLLERHVIDDYQRYHARMVATAVAGYAAQFQGDPELWFLTGLLHDNPRLAFARDQRTVTTVRGVLNRTSSVDIALNRIIADVESIRNDQLTQKELDLIKQEEADAFYERLMDDGARRRARVEVRADRLRCPPACFLRRKASEST